MKLNSSYLEEEEEEEKEEEEEEEDNDEVSLHWKQLQIDTNYLLTWASVIILERS